MSQSRADEEPGRTYRLRAADGSTCFSTLPGTLGGYVPLRIYGRLDCPSALRHLANGSYAAHRVFFADEYAAIAAGFRPCGNCLTEDYKRWKAGGIPNTPSYPWAKKPAAKAARKRNP